MGFLENVSEIMKKAQEGMFSGDFMRAAGILSDSRAAVREKLQEATFKEIKAVITKLEDNKPLISQDLDSIKLWIVGDAESYTKMENNYQDWLNEFDRLGSVLKDFENRQLSPGDLFKLQGILEDAVRVSADIGNYLEKKERIQRFQEATRDPASLDKELLVKMLRSKLISKDM